MTISAGVIVSILLSAVLQVRAQEPADTLHADTLYFRGTVLYTVTSRGDSSNPNMQLFQAFAPVAHTITFGSGRRIRLRDTEGISGTNMIVDLNRRLYYQLDEEERKALVLTRADYEGYFLPTVLEPMEEIEVIDGYPSRKYRIISSQFMRRGTVGYAWVTDSVRLLRERGDYNHEESGFRGLFPLPMVLGVEEGTIMKLEMTENDVTATYTTDLQPGDPEDDVFAIPEGYEVEK